MIGLFGGSFDPIHLGHLIIASSIREEFDLEKIIFIPNYSSPHKIESTVTDIQDRLEMIRISISGNPYFELSTFEADLKRPVFTYETLEHFKDLFKDESLYFIMGHDSFKNLSTWKNYKYLYNNSNFIVAGRSSQNTGSLSVPNVYFSLKSPEIGISSSLIRSKIANKLNIIYLVNSKVERYIYQKELYAVNKK